MKTVLKILFILFLGSLVFGFYLKSQQNATADIVIGLTILFLTFILMPLFIYHRYRKGKYKKYILDPTKKNPFKIDKENL
ncbi:hypothetical protein MWU59_02860 [Flavobacteriaceae bacterium F08102]|nr:hypothetical protein [Flavobacteriaceae bacterium F08102]